MCSPLQLFALYINDLITEIKQTAIGVRVGELKVATLLYADDIVLLSGNENDLQSLSNTVSSWCSKWRFKINRDKTQIMDLSLNFALVLLLFNSLRNMSIWDGSLMNT